MNNLDTALEALNIRLTKEELDMVKDALEDGEWHKKSLPAFK